MLKFNKYYIVYIAIFLTLSKKGEIIILFSTFDGVSRKLCFDEFINSNKFSRLNELFDNLLFSYKNNKDL